MRIERIITRVVVCWLIGAAPSTIVEAQAASPRVATIKPSYLPPAELADILGVRYVDTRGTLTWQAEDGPHTVEFRRNDSANLLIVSGSAADVESVEALAKSVDVPPRQIAVEARIVEIDQSRTRELGIDWDELVRGSGVSLRWSYVHDQAIQQVTPGARNGLRTTRKSLVLDASASLSRNLRLLEESGAATIRNAPRILTLNNRRATILDGQRVTYITRYSSFTNLFATDSMDAGLTLSVLPSLGESGYLTLSIRAELTSLRGDISGSPVKDGQMVENTVIVKDGETVLLGGFDRSTEQRVSRRFPILGYVLPFLFSRETRIHSTTRSFVVLTPRVVDLAAAADEKTRQVIEGK